MESTYMNNLMEAPYAYIVYLDFGMAFDTASHYRLLVEMKSLGISKR